MYQFEKKQTSKYSNVQKEKKALYLAGNKDKLKIVQFVTKRNDN